MNKRRVINPEDFLRIAQDYQDRIVYGTDASYGPDDIAANGGTINYEIICKISPRVTRIFVQS